MNAMFYPKAKVISLALCLCLMLASLFLLNNFELSSVRTIGSHAQQHIHLHEYKANELERKDERMEEPLVKFKELQGTYNDESLGELNQQSFLRDNRGIAHYEQNLGSRIKKLMSTEVSSSDFRLVNLIKDIIDPPGETETTKLSRPVYVTPQVTEVVKLLNNMEGGFFIECGALDGERSSNTLYLEETLRWKGLLIEADPYFYTQLLGKNRKSYSLNACLSPFSHPTELPFQGHQRGAGKIKLTKATQISTVPCFPFESIMIAMNRTRIQYFSLDVEGVELSILKTIPFEKFQIEVLSVEYSNAVEGKAALEKFMKEKGFIVHKDIHAVDKRIYFHVADFIFVNTNTALSKGEGKLNKKIYKTRK